jgi:hypothetical protein
MKKNQNKKQQGLSLFIVTIMVAVLMGLSLSVANIIIGSVTITSNLADAVKAFHCADSGIERALYSASGRLPPVSCDDILAPSAGTGFVGVSDTGYHYNVYDTHTSDGTSMNGTLDCAASGTTITASGVYGTATRRIKISY